MRRPFRWALDGAAVVLVVVVVAGVLVRMTIRDAEPWSASLYYALPLVVMAALLVAVSGAWLVAGRKGAAAIASAVAILFAGIWLARTSYSNPCRPGPDDIRVLLLNTARGKAGWHQVVRVLPPFDIDVIGLVEAGGKGPARQKFWEDNFPDHKVFLPGGGLAIITRGDVRRISFQPLDGISRYADAELDLNGRLLRVLLVDFDASPLFDRRRLVAAVFRAAESTPDIPTIVMGDFNTPIDSRWFERVRDRFRHVFEEAGEGLLVTWPTPLPLIAIDHIWVSESLRPTCATLEPQEMSDHRLVAAHLSPPSEDDSRLRRPRGGAGGTR